MTTVQQENAMFDTKNDLPVNTRTRVIELLNARPFLEAHLHTKR
jgi:hypothetical protein